MIDIVKVIRDFGRAYPEDVFPYPDQKTRLEVLDLYPGFIDGISASMGRHIASKIQPAADEIETLRQRVKELEGENKSMEDHIHTIGIMFAKQGDELKALKKELGECQVHFYAYEKMDSELAELRKAQEQPVCSTGEPVAWLFTGVKPGRRTEFASIDPSESQTWPTDEGYKWTIVPLYTSPPVATQDEPVAWMGKFLTPSSTKETNDV